MSTKKHGTREKVRNNKSEVRPNQTKKETDRRAEYSHVG